MLIKKRLVGKFNRVLILTIIFLLGVCSIGTALAADSNSDKVELILLQTTDLHGYVYNYNYFTGKDTKGSMSRAATLIKEERDKHHNTMLFDTGDTIQGSRFVYYWGIINPSQENNKIHVMAEAMNTLGYDAMALGNHEFQIGLPSLNAFLNDVKFPVLSANIVKSKTDELIFKPYVILNKKLDNGEFVKVGVLGLTTPGWYPWYGNVIDYVYEPKDMVAAAEKYVPIMKAEGAEIIVALSHSGIGYIKNQDGTITDNRLLQVSGVKDYPPENDTENIAKKVPNIDVIFFGHTHEKNVTTVKNEITCKDVLLIQGKQHGRGIGKAILELEKFNGKWKVISAQGDSIICDSKEHIVIPDKEFLTKMEPYHKATVNYMNTVIGKSNQELSSKTSRWTDSALIQFIADVQIWAVKNSSNNEEAIKNPILSMVAPFLNGADGADNYTDISPGDITIGKVGSIYLYDDVLQGIEINGKDLKAYLEKAAENFLQVKPDAGYQPILNPNFYGYYFDQIKGINYEIDITKPVGDRIINLKYDGKPIYENDKFTLLMNNYRAGGGGNFPGTGLGKTKIVYDEGKETRDFIVEYITKNKIIDPKPNHNWKLVNNFLNHWAEKYAYDLFEQGILLGDELIGTLRLNDYATREDLNLIIKNAWGKMDDKSKINKLSRGQAAIILAGVLENKGLKVNSENIVDFSDISKEDSRLIKSLELLSSNGIVKGNGRGLFKAEKQVTRGEICSMVWHALK